MVRLRECLGVLVKSGRVIVSLDRLKNPNGPPSVFKAKQVHRILDIRALRNVLQLFKHLSYFEVTDTCLPWAGHHVPEFVSSSGILPSSPGCTVFVRQPFSTRP